LEHCEPRKKTPRAGRFALALIDRILAVVLVWKEIEGKKGLAATKEAGAAAFLEIKKEGK